MRVLFGVVVAAFFWTPLGTKATAQELSESDVEYRAPEDGGVRRWRVAIGEALHLYDKPSRQGEAVSSLTANDIVANFGCSIIDDNLWCRVRPLHGRVIGFVKSEALEPALGPDGIVALGIDDSKKRARRKRFDETAVAACAQERGETLGVCDVGVARSGGGDATISATFPNGFSRLLFFEHGDFIRASSTMSGVGTDTDWELENGLHRIRVDDQQFEIREQFVLGVPSAPQ